jgi:ketosteroid isomerase-like protein
MIANLNRTRVLKFLKLFYARDTEGALACCSDDVELFASAPTDIMPHLGHRRGKDAVRETWQVIHGRYSDTRYDVPIIVAEGDKVAVVIRVFHRKVENQRVLQFDLAAFYTLRAGRITHIREILDTYDLVQQLLERDIGAELVGRKPDEA